MATISDNLRNAVQRIHERDLASLARAVRKQCIRRHESIGLRRELTHPLDIPATQVPFTVYESDPSAVALLAAAGETLPVAERRQLELRLQCATAGVGRCYVAFDTRNDHPCFVQWVFSASDNEWVRKFFRGRFPTLKTDEVLFENAYTPPSFRGLGVMSAAMATIALREAQRGSRYGLTFVAQDNIPSLKACNKAGFFPFMKRYDAQICFGLIRRRRFIQLAPSPQVSTIHYPRGDHGHHSAN